MIEKLLPFLTWRKSISKDTLRSDLIAGIIGAIIVFPQGIAFATIAGLPPQYGLYAAIVPAVIAALWGSSWHLVSGPTTAISLVVYASLSPFETPGTESYVALAITLAFMVGVMQFGLGLFRFGTLVRLISPTVVVGFTAGAGILIATSQINNALGISVPAGSHFLETWKNVGTHLDQINWYVFTITLVTLIIGILVRKYFKKIPYMIPAIITGSLLAVALNNHLGEAITGIKTIGELPTSLPPFSLPSFDLGTINMLATAALAITLLGLTEAVAIARSVANRSKQRIDGNQEFIGQGLSNIAGSFFSAYPSSGSFNRSGLNYEAGAKTPLASVFAALALIILILVLSPLAAYMPFAVMAGILFLVAFSIIDTHHIEGIIKSDRREAAVLIVTLLSTLFLELEFAIFIGVILSLALFIQRVMFAEVVEVGECPTNETLRKIDDNGDIARIPGVLMVRIDMSIIYMNSDAIFEKIYRLMRERRWKDDLPMHTLVLNCSGVNYIDIAGLDALNQFFKDMEEQGVKIGVINVKSTVRKSLEDSGLWNRLTFYTNIKNMRSELSKSKR